MEENKPIETARETFPQKLKRLLIPISALVCTVLGGFPFLLQSLSSPLGWDLRLSVWFQTACVLLVLIGAGLAVAGLCLRKKVKRAGIVLSVLAIVNPFALLGITIGGLQVAVMIFGM